MSSCFKVSSVGKAEDLYKAVFSAFDLASMEFILAKDQKKKTLVENSRIKSLTSLGRLVVGCREKLFLFGFWVLLLLYLVGFVIIILLLTFLFKYKICLTCCCFRNKTRGQIVYVS